MQRLFILIFVFSLIIRIWFNLFLNNANIACACDAAEYLRHAQNIALSLKNLLADPSSFQSCFHVLLGQASAADIELVRQIFLPLQTMSIAGPVFPIFLLLSYKICSLDPSIQLWIIPVLAQSILSALVCVLITVIGNNCWGRNIGITAGIISALYPGFIINSGRLYSESFACFLLCLVIWLIIHYLVSPEKRYFLGILLGATLFSLQTTRSIMCVLSIATVILFISLSIFSQDKQSPKRYLLAIAAGFFLFLLPWLALQKLAFGKASLIVDRVGNYNLFVGNNVDCLGWLSVPYPDLSKIEKQKYPEIIIQAVKRSPERFLKLLLDKPVRLFKLPWNDFRTTIGPISINTQSLFHQFILILAALGIIINSCSLNKQFYQPKTLGRIVILFAFLLHLVYLEFITVPRYALTAMPELILFAAFGLLNITDALRTKLFAPIAIRLLVSLILLMAMSQLNLVNLLGTNSATAQVVQSLLYTNILLKLTIFLLFLVACGQLAKCSVPSANRAALFLTTLIITFSALPGYCLPLRAHGRWYEYSQDFKNNDNKAQRNIALNQKQVQSLLKNEAYLAINVSGGSRLPTNWNFSINKIKVDGPFIPSLTLAEDLSLLHLNNNNAYTIEQESILKSLCDVSSISPLDLRQWYLIPINSQKWQEILGNKNKSSTTNLSVIINKSIDDDGILFGAYPSSTNFSIIPSMFSFSWEKAFYGVENQTGFTDPAYDQKIIASNNQRSPYIKLLIPELPTVSSNRHNIIYTPFSSLKLIDKECGEATSSGNKFKLTLKSHFEAVNPNNKENYWLIRIFGTVSNNDYKKTMISPSMYFSQSSDKPQSVSSFTTPWLPVAVSPNCESNESQSKFDLCFPVLISDFPKNFDHTELNLLKESVSKNVTTKNQSNALYQFTHLKSYLEIYQMAHFLSGVHYEIL